MGLFLVGTIVTFGMLISCSDATLKWDNLRITFGLNPFSSSNFSPMPLTAANAVEDGWQKISTTCSNDNKFYGFRYMYENDPGITLLYDVNGIIAGIQMNLLQSEVLLPENLYKFGKVSMYQNTTVKGQGVFTLTAYFVNPETICTTGRTQADLDSQGTGTALYLQNGATVPLDDTNVIKVPLNRSQAIVEGWTKNNCFWGMGYHNFYKSEKYQETECQEIRPVFLLYNADDELHGFGLTANGHATSPRFEHPGERAIKAIIGSDAAQCILDATKSPGISTVHIYFVNRPYYFNCWF